MELRVLTAGPQTAAISTPNGGACGACQTPAQHLLLAIDGSDFYWLTMY